MSPAAKKRQDAKNKGDKPSTDAISRDDIESQLRTMTGGVEQRAEQAKSYLTVAAVAVGAALLVAVYVFGRRRGHKRTPVVEIRRI